MTKGLTAVGRFGNVSTEIRYDIHIIQRQESVYICVCMCVLSSYQYIYIYTTTTTEISIRDGAELAFCRDDDVSGRQYRCVPCVRTGSAGERGIALGEAVDRGSYIYIFYIYFIYGSSLYPKQ